MKRWLAILVCVFLLATMIPMGVVNVGAESYEYAMFPMTYLRISQGVNGSFSHQGTNAIDITGKDGGIDSAYAPFTGVIKKIYEGHVVWLESSNPVIYANGVVDYMTIMVVHDNDTSDLYVGKTIQQGERFYEEGMRGNATGNHIHLECGKGKFQGTGWHENGQGKWMINNSIVPYDALYISEKTVVLEGYGYNWKVAASIPDGLVSQVYRSHCKVKVTKNTTVKTYPCSPQTNAGSLDVETASIGDEYEAIEMVRNTATSKGNLWYKVKTKNGRTGFLFAGNTEFVQQLTSDVSLSGIVAPTTVIQGKDFAIGGTVSAPYQTITKVGAYVTRESGTLSMWRLENVSVPSYTLNGSTIDSGMQFDQLAAGNYTYKVGVEVQTYYAKSATQEGTASRAYDLHSSAFVVDGNHKHNYTTYVYYWAAHPHYNCYQCACGEIAHNEAEPRYIESCEQCNPSVPSSGVYAEIDEGVYFLRCKGDGNYLSIADGTDYDANPIQNYAFGNCDFQAFQISKAADGYVMRPLSSATRVLNVDANIVASGNLVNLFRSGNNATQWFKFEAVDDGYVIRNAQNPNVCLTPDGNRTIVYEYKGSSNQIWYLEKACIVTFNANGGSGAPAAMRVREGYAITIPTEQPTRTCHSFKFWVESQSFSPTTLRGGDTFTIYGDVIISAIWGAAHHTYSDCEDTSCNECGDIRSEAGHIYDNSCDSNCNVCGAERAVEHCLLTRDTEITCSYRVIRTSCVFCDFLTEEIVYTNLMPHTYDDKYDADCNECGAVREVPEKPALIYGDATGDGAVNNRDLAMMQQYINGWEVVVDADACDVNVDGAINNRDLALLQQYINGWDVTLG